VQLIRCFSYGTSDIKYFDTIKVLKIAYIHILHISEQPGVADRRDADDRLRAASSAPFSTIINGIRDTRSFLQNDRL
jgi:hypothetical protein